MAWASAELDVSSFLAMMIEPSTVAPLPTMIVVHASAIESHSNPDISSNIIIALLMSIPPSVYDNRPKQ